MSGRGASENRLTSEGLRVIVLDFDDTLVASERLKRDAFFKVVEHAHESHLKRILERRVGASRHEIFGELVEVLAREGHRSPAVHELTAAYDQIASAAAISCDETPGATRFLRHAGNTYALFLFSHTPEASLRRIVESRGWTRCFEDIFGYPAKKADVLTLIGVRKSVSPDAMLVVGDGESDAQAAAAVGCRYFRVTPHSTLELLNEQLGIP